MRYVVVGAGAVGGGTAALLHEAGRDVQLVARGRTLAALRADGLDLAVGGRARAVPVPTLAGLHEATWDRQSVLVLAVKSQHTPDLLPALAHVPTHVPVLCLQNSVANERLLLAHRDPATVHGVVVMMPASSLRPGSVVLHSLGRPGLLDLGLATGGHDHVDRAVAADLVAAGFDSVPREDVMAWKRRKLLLNLGNAVDAAYRRGPEADELVDLVRREGVAAFAAAGLPVVGEEEDRVRRGELLRPLVRRDEAGSSTWQSIERGTGDTEADLLNGEVVRLGARYAVATPANAAVLDDVQALAASRGRPRSLDASTVLARL